MSSFFKVDNIKNEAILPDFFIFQTWQHQKRGNSARLPSKMESCMHTDGIVPMRFAIFPVHLSKLLRLPRKSDARSYEGLHLSRKIIFPKLKIWCSKMQPLSGNQRPDLLTALMKMSLVLRLPRKMHLCRSCSNVPRLPLFLEMHGNATKPSRFAHLWQGPQSLAPTTRRHIWTSKSGPNPWCFLHFDFEMCFAPQRRALFWHLNFQKWSGAGVSSTFWLRNVLPATTASTFSTSQLPKVSEREVFFAFSLANVLRASSRHNSVHFFDISTSKSGPNVPCFYLFHLQMCVVPQQRALFRHRNFQRWSEREVFLAFSLANVLRATTACNFSSLIWPGGSAPAALASLLFDPLEPHIIGKTQHFATFLPFRASASSFFWLFLFSDLLSSSLLFSLTLPISAFHLSTLSEVWLLNFLRLYSIWCTVHIDIHTHMCAELLRPSSSMVRKPVPQRQDAVTTLLSRLFLGLPRAGKIGPHAVRAWSSFMYRQAASCKPCCKPRPSWHKLDLGMWSLAEIESFYRRTLSSFVKSIPMRM